jgi:hypothetical protein
VKVLLVVVEKTVRMEKMELQVLVVLLEGQLELQALLDYKEPPDSKAPRVFKVRLDKEQQAYKD